MILSDRIHQLLTHWPIKILCVAIALIFYLVFRMNTLQERQFTVPLEAQAPSGLIISSEYPHNVNVLLRGNEEDLKEILPDDIEAFINLDDFEEKGTYKVPIELRKKGAALKPEALELKTRPRELSLSLEQRTVRSLVVRPELSGFPAVGYELTQFFISPSSVTVVGPHSQILELTELTTELIDISGRRNDFTVTSRIVRPSSQIHIPGGQIVEFRGVIEETVIISTITDGELVIFDFPEDLDIEGELPHVSLTVQGSQLNIENIRPKDLNFYVDGSSIRSPGNYVLPITIDIPPDLAVLQIDPRELAITVIRADAKKQSTPSLEFFIPPERALLSEEARGFGTNQFPERENEP